MADHEVRLSESAQKDLTKLQGEARRRVLAKLADLSLDPKPQGIKQLQGFTNVFRIRAGDYRIVYRIERGEIVVLVIVLRIRHRKDVYRNL